MRNVTQAIIFVLILFVYVLSGPQSARAQAGVQAGVLEPLTTVPDTVVEVPIQVVDVTGLYAVDIELTFDPSVVTAEDADPASPGVQLGIGNFLDAGLVLYNEVDSQQGIARFVMTQVNPSEPKSGSGVLVVLYLKGVQVGKSALLITNVQLAGRTGVEIPSSGVNSTLTVAATGPTVSATAIPVVNPTSITWIPNPAPTQATQAIAQTSQPIPSEQSTPQATQIEQKQFIPAVAAGENPAKPQVTSWLVEHWWIVLIAAGLVAGLGIYLYRTR
ncbi:MAG: cohesin domain-containing protein [Bellilinea sp.]